MKLHKLLGLPENDNHVVSLCGGGGKTTLMYALARESAEIMPTALFTTTHILPPNDADVALLVPFSEDKCRAAWEEGKIVSSGTFLREKRKFGPPEENVMRFLCREAASVIIEADGAKRLPIKSPAAWEPVIREENTHTVVMAGLSALGKDPETIVHRFALAKECVDLSGHALNEEQAARLLWTGYAKYSPIFFLNQADSPELLESGERICGLLRSYGALKAVTASLLQILGKNHRGG